MFHFKPIHFNLKPMSAFKKKLFGPADPIEELRRNIKDITSTIDKGLDDLEKRLKVKGALFGM